MRAPTVPSLRLTAGLSVSACALVAACGSLGGDGGGGSNLPNPGIVPYEKLVQGSGEEESEFVLATDSSDERYLEPSAVEEGGAIVLYLEHARADGTAAIARTESTDGGFSFGAPEEVVEPGDLSVTTDVARAGAPAVLHADSRWLMAAAVGDGDGIVILERRADGTWTELPETWLAADRAGSEAGGVDSPSLARFDSRWLLYYTARAEPDSGGVIVRATAGDDLRFTRSGVVLLPQAEAPPPVCIDADLDGSDDPGECVEPDGDTWRWNKDGVEAAEVRVGTTGSGRAIFRMFYEGVNGRNRDVGYAASFDGIVWSRFAYNPVLHESASERQPTNIFLGDRYLLFWVLESPSRGRGIAIGINDEGTPTTRF